MLLFNWTVFVVNCVSAPLILHIILVFKFSLTKDQVTNGLAYLKLIFDFFRLSWLRLVFMFNLK